MPDLASRTMPLSRWRLSSGTAVSLVVLGLATVLAAQMLSVGPSLSDSLTTDDVMRLVEVRDLIAGQNWYDLTQYRLNPPGTAMHWSRLIDLPLAASIVALKPFLGTHGAESVTLIVWPLLLLVAALALVVAIARELTGGSLAAAIAAATLALLAKPTLLHFRPGAIDHHNAQMVLLLALLLSALQIERSAQKASLAAIAASLSFAIGVEMLPAIAACCLTIVGLFIWRGAVVAKQVASFGIALAISSLVLALALLPPASIVSPVCDAFGGPTLLLTIGGGAGLVSMTFLDRFFSSFRMRLASAALVGTLLIAAFIVPFGRCLTSPYGQLDPLVASMWLDKVQEAVSFAGMLRVAPEEVLGFYGLPTITLALVCGAIIKCYPVQRFPWICACATLSAALVISLWQLRGSPGANLVAAPLFVAAVASLWPRLAAGRGLALLAMAASPTAFAVSGALAKPVTDAIFKPETILVTPSQCSRMSDVAAMKSLAKARIAAPIDLGPTLLAQTSHEVIAAPFHRNIDGNLALLRLMLATPQEAQRMMIERQIDYVVICRASPDKQFISTAPSGLEAVLARGDTPDFLDPIDLGPNAKIAVWRLRH